MIFGKTKKNNTPMGFNWDLYYRDLENGLSCSERIKNRKNGRYDLTQKDIDAMQSKRQ